MAWQNFEQFDLYNETKAHDAEYWSVVGDDGRPVCAKPPCSYNMTNPAMRAAWVATLKTAMDSGVIDGFFIDITPQALPNTDNTTYASNIEQICPAARCSPERQQGLLDGLRLAFDELAAAVGPEAIIICNPADFETCVRPNFRTCSRENPKSAICVRTLDDLRFVRASEFVFTLLDSCNPFASRRRTSSSSSSSARRSTTADRLSTTLRGCSPSGPNSTTWSRYAFARACRSPPVILVAWSLAMGAPAPLPFVMLPKHGRGPALCCR